MSKIIGLIGLLLVLASCQKQEKIFYEIVFYDSETQIIETTTMAEGSPIVFINEDISKEGYALLGWETAENLRIYEGDLVT
ncbi:MAG: hypothetical protein RBQ71_02655, partial [Acholeplasmataceae bacterium]|nr:hypothetical protein [Acholeplasmataceae bacterium]